MPYQIVRRGCPNAKPFAVVAKGEFKPKGCHATEALARKQVSVLYAKEKGVASEAEGPLEHARAEEVFTASEAIKWQEPQDGKPPRAEIVIIRPGESKNKRHYGREAIQRAVNSGFWNGSRMHIDHAPQEKKKLMPAGQRPLRDYVAAITETWLGEEGEARGIAEFRGRQGREFAELAQEAPEHVGVSVVHEFKGRRFRGPDGYVHESVDDFLVNHAVDWVGYPSAGGGISRFLPAQESEEDVEWSDLTPEMVEEHAPAVHTAIIARATASESEGDDSPAVAQESLTVEQVRAIVSEAVEAKTQEFETRRSQEADTRRQVADAISKSGLPPRTQARLISKFDGQTAFAQESVDTAVEEARAELREAGVVRGPQITGLGASVAPQGAAITTEERAQQFPTLHAVESVMMGERSTGAGGDA